MAEAVVRNDGNPELQSIATDASWVDPCPEIQIAQRRQAAGLPQGNYPGVVGDENALAVKGHAFIVAIEPVAGQRRQQTSRSRGAHHLEAIPDRHPEVRTVKDRIDKEASNSSYGNGFKDRPVGGVDPVQSASPGINDPQVGAVKGNACRPVESCIKDGHVSGGEVAAADRTGYWTRPGGGRPEVHPIIGY